MREIRIPGLRRVLRVSLSRRAIGREVEDEIGFHLDARARELMRLGMTEHAAREQAFAEYGDVEASRRELITVDSRRADTERTEEMVMSFRDDLRYAARSLGRRPALLAVITLTLGLGIGANAIMFGVVDQLLLRPPAHVADAASVRRINFRDVSKDEVNVGPTTTYLVLTALRTGAPGFSELAAFGYPNQYSLGRGRDAQNVAVQLVSGNYFRLLGVRPQLGRAFTDDDDRVPVGEPVALLGYRLWERQFGADSAIIGRTIVVQGKTLSVIGVAPRGFAGIDRQNIDIWIPISALGKETLGDGWYNTTNNWWASIIGRVRDGVSPEVAAGQATMVYRGLLRGWKDNYRDSTSSVVLSSIIGTRTPNGLSRESKVSLWLTGVSAIVLLIACANVANLLVARTMERRREIAVRLALGVSRGRLARMLLTEAALLALLGSVAAIVIAYASSRLVQNILLPNIVWGESVIDLRVLGFTLAVAVLCVLLAGLAPALQGMSTGVTDGLKASSRQVAGGSGRLRFTLMLAQAALSVVLLVGAGLFVSSLRNVSSRHLGLDRDRVLRVTMPLSRFGFDSTRIEEIYRRGVERVRALPGVTSVAVAAGTYPMGNASAGRFSVPGVTRPKFELGGPYQAAVTGDFFATIGAPILKGRSFTPQEEQTGARVIVVNDVIARGYWPNENPIGKCVIYGKDKTCSTVIGVVGTVLQFSLINDDRALAYVPPRHPGNEAAPGAMLVRVAGAPGTIVPLVRRELQALDAAMPFVNVKAYSELVAPQLQPWRLGATMFTVFGVIAVLIAAVGLYSVTAYWVSQRTHEIGVRMALGAQRADVIRLVAMQSARAIGAGLVIGGLIALAGSRWITSMLYETSPYDPAVYAWAAAILAAAAVVASVVPARRSTAIDPALAIKAE